MNDVQIKEQSIAAFNQWRTDWIENAKHNKKYITRSMYDSLQGIGKGKTLIVVANGPSLSKHWNLLKKYRHQVHIACVDKSFKPLMNHGIKPDYVILCDANVSYEKYCKGIDTRGVALLANVCAEKNWIANWKGPMFFFVNKDAIRSEDLFINICDYAELIPAASNVSNALLIVTFFVLKYEMNLLTGYDYSWKLGSYYSDGPEDKQYWMANAVYSDISGNLVRTSNNLIFSAKWMGTFFQTAKARNYINCSEQGLMYGIPTVPLEKQLKKRFKESAAFAA